jgi:hypothetical protein
MIRELVILGAGILIGMSFMAAVSGVLERRRADRQWFEPAAKPPPTRSEAPGRPTPGPRAQQPEPARIVGQRPSEGRHRPKQVVGRFPRRTRRVRTEE